MEISQKTVDNEICQIHDMLIEYMNESSVSSILNKIRNLVDKSVCIGFEDGWDKCTDKYNDMMLGFKYNSFIT